MNKKGWVVLFVVLAVMGFNDRVYSASKSPDRTKDMTLTEAMKKLQERGELPVLDTTDTLAGIDTDGDGIRDDIQAFIDKLDVSDEQKQLYREFAKALQAEMLVDTTDERAVKVAAKNVLKAPMCNLLIRGQDPEQQKIRIKYFDQIAAYSVNTKIRVEQSNKIKDGYSGSVWRLVPVKGECK